MAYSPWFWSILGHFHTPFFNIDHALFICIAFWTILDQKAWPIAHGFGPILGHFHTFFKDFVHNSFHRFWTILDQKAWPIAHGFGPILGHFHTFFKD